MASEADTTQMEEQPTVADTMVVEHPQSEPAAVAAADGEVILKRERDEPEFEAELNGDGVSKKQKTGDPDEEEEEEEDDGEGEGMVERNKDGEKTGPVKLGPKNFESSVEMFDYFCQLLHLWPPNVNVNKYEFMVLLDLVKKGYLEPEKKLGVGIQAFQIRDHPMWKSRCFFLVRTDESFDDFSFRKCVDHILPLPENMKVKPEVNKALGGGGRGHGNKGRGGCGGGRGRGGKSRK